MRHTFWSCLIRYIIWNGSDQNYGCYRVDKGCRTDKQTDRWTNRRRDGVKPIYPSTTSLLGDIISKCVITQISLKQPWQICFKSHESKKNWYHYTMHQNHMHIVVHIMWESWSIHQIITLGSSYLFCVFYWNLTWSSIMLIHNLISNCYIPQWLIKHKYN